MNKLTRRLSPLLGKIKLFNELTEAECREFDVADGRLAEVESNMTLSGTTQSQIARREEWYGIVPDESKLLSDRVAVLVSRHRGQGTTTPDFVRNVARSFQYGEIDIDETSEPLTVIISFLNVMGLPPNMTDFKAALSLVAPAHITLEYVYKYLTWDDFESYNKTWDEWEALNLTWDELQVYDGKKGVI